MPASAGSGDSGKDTGEAAGREQLRGPGRPKSLKISQEERRQRRLESNRMAAKRAYYRRLDRNSLMAEEVQKLSDEVDQSQRREAMLEAAVISGRRAVNSAPPPPPPPPLQIRFVEAAKQTNRTADLPQIRTAGLDPAALVAAELGAAASASAFAAASTSAAAVSSAAGLAGSTTASGDVLAMMSPVTEDQLTEQQQTVFQQQQQLQTALQALQQQQQHILQVWLGNTACLTFTHNFAFSLLLSRHCWHITRGGCQCCAGPAGPAAAAVAGAAPSCAATAAATAAATSAARVARAAAAVRTDAADTDAGSGTEPLVHRPRRCRRRGCRSNCITHRFICTSGASSNCDVCGARDETGVSI